MRNRKKILVLCLTAELVIFAVILIMIGKEAGNFSAAVGKNEVPDSNAESLPVATESIRNESSTESGIEALPDYADSLSISSGSSNVYPDLSGSSTPAAAQKPQINSFLTDISALDAGYVFTEGQFDAASPEQYFTAVPIPDAVFERINGKSYRENDNISLDQLRYLKVVHYNFDHQVQVGEIIVNAALASDFLSVFQELFADGYEICQMHLVDDYWTGDPITTDTASIDMDNTSAFNYRTATNSSKLSNHAFGCAVDLNPLENPYVTFSDSGAAHVYHDNAEQYKDNRTSDEPHVITHEDTAFNVFKKYGFSWGGDWNNPRDYQHFEKEVSR